MKKLILLTVIAFFAITFINAQNVGINTDGTLPHPSAMLDVKNPNKGMLMPRVALTGTTDAATIPSPAVSLLVYNTATAGGVTPGYYYWSGTAWLMLSTGSGAASGTAWLLTGNAGTVDGTNFIGTTDNVPFNIRVNNKQAGRIDPTLENTFLGYLAGNANTTGRFNTANGYGALFSNTTGTRNTANGESALILNTTGNRNTANGVSALASNTHGESNTANGAAALASNTIGEKNTANGATALASNTTGFGNTANGVQALLTNTTGNLNTGTGNRALEFNINGFANTASGALALFHNISGEFNTGIGHFALERNQFGNNNTAIGTLALAGLDGGSNNIAIGFRSGTDPGSPGVTNTISIGNDGILNAASNQAFIGNLSTIWNGGNKPWSTYSDARMKNNIKEDVKGLDFITRLKPVTYYRSINAVTKIIGSSSPATQASQAAGQAGKPIKKEYAGKYDVEKIKETGFLAQDVEQAAKAAGFDFSGITIPRSSNQLYTLSYEVFVVPLVKAVQEQQVIIEGQQKQIDDLKKEIAGIKVLLHK